jgi:poly-gamma-glutamate capsule biosynthesis protein CapA/YwtB (metallophosphatase superfamily)
MRAWLSSLLVLAGCGTSGATEQVTTASPSEVSPPATTASPVSSPVPAPPERLVLVAAGDVNLGRNAGQRILADPSYDPFRHVAPLLEGDLTFVNLESQLSDQKGETQSPTVKLMFTGPPAGADVIARAGIDVVSLANNHAWDYGRPAFEETLQNLERVGIPWVGVAREPGKQYEPTILKARGFSIALFAVTHIWNIGRYSQHPARMHVAWADARELVPRIAKARSTNDLVIVSYHGDVEYSDKPFPPTLDFVRAVMKAGADVVLGHHPHVPRGIEWHDGRPALYGLGNLVFDKRSDHRWERTSFVARLTFERGERTLLAVCPYDLQGDEPVPFAADRRAKAEEEVRDHLVAISAPLGGSRVGPADGRGCMEVAPPSP